MCTGVYTCINKIYLPCGREHRVEMRDRSCSVVCTWIAWNKLRSSDTPRTETASLGMRTSSSGSGPPAWRSSVDVSCATVSVVTVQPLCSALRFLNSFFRWVESRHRRYISTHFEISYILNWIFCDFQTKTMQNICFLKTDFIITWVCRMCDGRDSGRQNLSPLRLLDTDFSGKNGILRDISRRKQAPCKTSGFHKSAAANPIAILHPLTLLGADKKCSWSGITHQALQNMTQKWHWKLSMPRATSSGTCRCYHLIDRRRTFSGHLSQRMRERTAKRSSLLLLPSRTTAASHLSRC